MSLRALLNATMHDLYRWRRMPFTAATAVVPPLAMMLILSTLSIGVTTDPTALVVEGRGPYSIRMAQIIENDTDAFLLTVCDNATANAMLESEQVLAVIIIPSTFDSDVKNGTGKVQLTLYNVDYDSSDDVRRAVAMSVVEFNEPTFAPPNPSDTNSSSTNPYHVSFDENYLRATNVDWFHYQLVPTFVLMALNVGLVGTAVLSSIDEESGTARMRILSPQRASTLVASRILGGAIVCLLLITPMLLFSEWIGFISVPTDQIPALIGIFAGTAVCASGIGAMVGTLIKGTKHVAFLSTVLATYLFILGGGFSAIEFDPRWLQSLSVFLPTTYSIDALRQVLFYPNPTGVPMSLAVLWLIAAACVGVGALLLRRSWLHG